MDVWMDDWINAWMNKWQHPNVQATDKNKERMNKQTKIEHWFSKTDSRYYNYTDMFSHQGKFYNAFSTSGKRLGIKTLKIQ